MTVVGAASVIGDNGGSGSPRDLTSRGSRSASASVRRSGAVQCSWKGEKREGKRQPLDIRPLNEIGIQERKDDTEGSCRCLRMRGLEITENRGGEEGVTLRLIQDIGGPSIFNERNVEET